MRNGIVQGEPGIFPWPVGRFFHWISKIGHRDHQEQEPAGAADTPAGGSVDAPPAEDYGATDKKSVNPDGA